MHHKGVHVSHNFTVKPWAGASSSVTTLKFWNACSGILKETTSETLCWEKCDRVTHERISIGE